MIQRIIQRLLREQKRISTAVSEYRWWNSPSGRKNKQQLISLKDSYKGKRCFVMANGPSLKLCDLTLLKDEVTICSNAQFLIWDEMGYVPTFLTVEDRLVAEDRGPELNAIESTTKIFPRDLAYCLQHTPKTIFIDFKRNYSPFPKFSEGFQKEVFWGGTVSFLNLQLAYHLGCDPIYLIGFDHNYKVTEKIDNYVITSDKDDVNHIHPDYFGKGYRWHDPNVERMERSYIAARKFFDEQHVGIFNATVGGKLEVFKRIDFNDIFTK